MISFVAMLLAIFGALTPSFYSVTYTDDDGDTVERNISLFFALFEDPDWVTIAAFVFLLVAAFFCSCGGALLNASYKNGFGEHEENLPATACCLSTWFVLDGTLGVLSLVVSESMCSLLVCLCIM